MHIRFKEATEHYEITVYDAEELYGEKGKFRVLQFSNEAIQGAIDLNRPERIVFEYPRAIIHLMECNNPSFDNVFVIGHGIGTIAVFFPGKRFKVAELDSKIVELSRAYFGYRNDNVVVGDGRQILANENPQAYDYIILDAFTDKGTPPHLTSMEFFGIVRDKLDPAGSVIMNLTGKGANDKRIKAVYATLGETFAYVQSFSLPSDKSSDMQNIILVGRNKPIRFQARQMAGFTEVRIGEGHILFDADLTKKEKLLIGVLQGSQTVYKGSFS